MSGEPSLLRIFVEFLPVMLILGLSLWLTTRIFRRHGKTQFQYLEEQLAEAKRHNTALEAILRDIRDGLARAEANAGKSIAS